jgi:ferredoxin
VIVNGGRVRPENRKLKVTVDHSVCVGNAACIATASAVFALDEAMQSTVVDPEGAPAELILEAAETCPVSAITVVDTETGDQLFP